MRRVRMLPLATIALLLVALASPAGTPLGPRPAGPPARSLAGGSLAALELGVLPVRDRGAGEVGPARPEPGPSGVHGLLALKLTTGGQRRLRGRCPGARTARRRLHHTAGAPRGPPATPLPS
ncbi:MAG TPA: hypothetical protein VGC06_33320 [Actinomycetes bacterium]